MNEEFIEVRIIDIDFKEADSLDGEKITITRNKNQIFINNGYSTYEYCLSKISAIEVMAAI